jgi:hypothetical protein
MKQERPYVRADVEIKAAFNILRHYIKKRKTLSNSVVA